MDVLDFGLEDVQSWYGVAIRDGITVNRALSPGLDFNYERFT